MLQTVPTVLLCTGAVLPADSKIDAIGVYSPGCTAQLSVRNLALWAPLN